MMFIKAFQRALTELRAQKREARLKAVLTDDPITIELIKKIAVEFQYHFEIGRPDGTVFRFFKDSPHTISDEENDGWGV